jgi:arginyl-tRNA synthetase
MIGVFHSSIRSAILDALARLYQLDATSAPAIVLQPPPTRDLGDLATPLAFELARKLRKAPRAIAQEIVGALDPIEGVARVEATSAGYVNVFLDRATFLRRALGNNATRPEGSSPSSEEAPAPEQARAAQRAIVEHTAINPNKAAHIGHLRNSTLGDTLVRMLRASGIPVEVQNYIDDTGVQVADVVVGFRELEGLSLDQVRRIAESTRFDYYCWDLYARVTDWYVSDATRLQVRRETLHAIEHGTEPAAGMAAFIADRIVRCHLATMARLNVDYDLLTWEGDILRLEFWKTAFDILRESGDVFLQQEGKLAGCWVMRIDDGVAGESDGRQDSDDEGDEQREKVIVRSDGTVTYVGKDIAYQFWKFGLLGRDFYYRPFETRRDGRTLWATTSRPGDAVANHPPFGRAAWVYNVIDTRQAYLQKLLKQALATLGHVTEAERSNHFAYEMVALSHRTAREMGYEAIDESKPFVEVSGRKGLGVKADELIDRVIEKALAEVQARNPDMPPDQQRRTAETIGVAAVRYFLVKFTRTKIIAFDIDDALSFEGESGPYLQYSVVRAQNIFAKLAEREGMSEASLGSLLAGTPADPLQAGAEGDELWNLALEAARLDEMIDQAVRTLEPAVVAKYAFSLAQSFNALYHKYPVINEPRPEWRIWRAAVFSLFRRQLTRALDVMGASVPSRM